MCICKMRVSCPKLCCFFIHHINKILNTPIAHIIGNNRITSYNVCYTKLLRLLRIFLDKGLENACFGLILAAVIAEFISFLLLLICYLYDIKKYKPTSKPPEGIIKQLLNISMPIAFSSYVCTALYTIKNIMIPLGLIKSGLTRDVALAQFGLITGMVLPIILFPQAFLSAFSCLIVPEITECYKLNNTNRINNIVSRAFQMTLIFSIAMIGIFLKFPFDFGMVIYNDMKIGILIQILAPLVLIMYLDSVVDAMLKGLDQQVSSMFYNIFDSTFSIVLVFFILPRFGIKGLLLIMFLSKLFNTFLSVNKIIKITNFKIDLKSWIVKPIISIFISVTMVELLNHILKITYTSSLPILSINIFITLLIYYLLLRLLNCISKSDIKLLKGVILRIAYIIRSYTNT